MRIFSILLLLLFCTAASTQSVAQQKLVKRSNFEFGLGYSFVAKRYPVLDNKYRIGCQLEWRYNLAVVPVDIGLQLSYSTFKRESFKFRSLAVLPVADYVFRRGYRVSPYIGAGLGVAFGGISGIFNDGYKTNLCFMPRIGVRLFNHLNISLDYQLHHRDHSHMNLKVGYFF